MATNYYQQWAPQSYQNTSYQPVHQVEPAQHATAKWGLTPTEYLVQDSNENTTPKQSWFQAHFGGLKRTLRLSLAVAVIVLIVNVSWLLYAKFHYGGIDSGLGIIQRGDCDTAKLTNTWLHLLINVLSTLLLTGSNAFMSTYCCPSRKEVDKAHARRKWLHVGMLSLRNLSKIAKRKSLIVLLLCFTSVPFHLLYNSLVFVSLSANNYYYTIGTPEFLDGASYNLTGPLRNTAGSLFWMLPALPGATYDRSTYVPYRDTATVDQLYNYYDQIQKNASSWERLSNPDCIQAYSNVFMTGRRNVVLISSDKNSTNSVLDYGISELDNGAMDNNWWICSRVQDGGNIKCQPDDFKANANNWTVWGFPIDYCLSEQIDDVCEVEFSMDIMIVVIVFNLIKVIAMTWVLLRYNAEDILATVGDSVSSFLEREDETTRGMCLAGWREINHAWRYPGTGVVYQPRRLRWAKAVSTGKWSLFILMMLASFCIIAFFGGWGFVHTKSRGTSLSFSSLWELGFGRAHQDAIVIYDRVTSLIGMALLANTPQLLLAAVWLLYMGILTSMFLAADWAVFGTRGQSLMVKNARGEQRGTWLLSAPLAWGLSLLILQVILHWLISQSIFLISLNIYDPDGDLTQYRQGGSKFLNCGYSPIAIIFCVIASVLLMLSAIALAFRRLPQGAPPVVATSSAAISAACHLPYGMLKHDSLYGHMRWGQCGQLQHGAGHCALVPEDAFKNGYAQAPVPGWTYI